MAKKTAKPESLGERIQATRKKHNVDLETLAFKTGLTTEYLQEIESGDTAPPVGALIQISKALAVDSGELLAEEKKKERRKSYRKRTKAYSYKNLTPGAEDKHLWAYLITLEPKKKHEKVEYQHEGEEFAYVLEGRVEIEVAGETNVLKKGSALHFNSDLPHTLTNLSTKQSKLLVVVYAP
jgi:transcriptional regulator with XRE-family HTH domain